MLMHLCRGTFGMPSGPWALYGDSFAICLWIWSRLTWGGSGSSSGYSKCSGFSGGGGGGGEEQLGKSPSLIFIVIDECIISCLVSDFESQDSWAAAIAWGLPDEFVCSPYVGGSHILQVVGPVLPLGLDYCLAILVAFVPSFFMGWVVSKRMVSIWYDS